MGHSGINGTEMLITGRRSKKKKRGTTRSSLEQSQALSTLIRHPNAALDTPSYSMWKYAHLLKTSISNQHQKARATMDQKQLVFYFDRISEAARAAQPGIGVRLWRCALQLLPAPWFRASGRFSYKARWYNLCQTTNKMLENAELLRWVARGDARFACSDVRTQNVHLHRRRHRPQHKREWEKTWTKKDVPVYCRRNIVHRRGARAGPVPEVKKKKRCKISQILEWRLGSSVSVRTPRQAGLQWEQPDEAGPFLTAAAEPALFARDAQFASTARGGNETRRELQLAVEAKREAQRKHAAVQRGTA